MKWIVISLLCLTSLLHATGSRQVFAKYPNRFFLESGSFYGDGIQMALDAHFEKIFSIELSPHFYQHCVNRFASFPNVFIIPGDSSRVLAQVLLTVDAPATIWLDGHYSWGNTARGDTNTPIMRELECIAKHPIKTHTILIDDVRQFGTIEFDFIELEELVQKILEINPEYQISFEDGYAPNDILVAKVSQ